MESTIDRHKIGEMTVKEECRCGILRKVKRFLLIMHLVPSVFGKKDKSNQMVQNLFFYGFFSLFYAFFKYLFSYSKLFLTLAKEESFPFL